MNQSFFSNIAKNIPAEKSNNIRFNCDVCGLYRGCRSPKMLASGEGKRGILILAEAPGQTEDEQGTQLIGQAGQQLRSTLKLFGVDIDRDCRKINSVNCRPKGNREPKPIEIDCCRARVLKEIYEFKPKVIIPLGNVAVQCLLGHRWHKDLDGVMRWRGWQIPDRDLNAWVCPTFHPSFVMRSKDNLSVVNTFTDDLKVAVACTQKPFPTFTDEKKEVTIVEDEQKAFEWLGWISVNLPDMRPNWLSIDYETTGIKPQLAGHEIVSCALAWYDGDNITCIAFKMTPKLAERLKTKILQNPRINKIAHGFKFEELWSRVILGTKVESWLHCTQTAAHVMDSRSGTSWLKFQVYTNFGRIDYDSHIEPFLEGIEPNNANSFNRIKEIPIKELLLYNGLDVIHTLKLASVQMKTLKQWDGYHLMHQGSLCFVDLEEQGICVDAVYLNKQVKRINVQEKTLINSLMEEENIKVWKKKYGEDFNLFSPIQLKYILFEHLKIKPLAFTAATKSAPQGNPSISSDTLEDYVDKAPFVKDLVKLRKLMKVRDTFLKGISQETVEGKLHPFFKLNTVDSFRSSSTNPNAQNWPNRDVDMQKIIRSCLKPTPGNMLLEVDYSGAEVRGAASHCKDPQLIKYITDPTTDMHRDMACELFLLPAQEVRKALRYIAKNGFVFPEFYGSYYKEVGPAIWKTLSRNQSEKDKDIFEHLAMQGILSEKDFTEHVKRVEQDLWGNRFRVYGQWKEKTVEKYCTNGYMDTPTGFRIHGPLRRNQISNFSIQGSSFHMLLWSLITLNNIGKREGWKSKPISQIHDSILYDLYPPEKDHVIETIKRVMTIEVREHWPWIIVPLSVEFECTEIDGSWYSKKKLEV